MTKDTPAPLSKNPKMVFTGIKTQCEKKCGKVASFLDEHEEDAHLDPEQVEELKGLMKKLRDQQDQMGEQWKPGRYMDIVEDPEKSPKSKAS